MAKPQDVSGVQHQLLYKAKVAVEGEMSKNGHNQATNDIRDATQ
jgi:hypothetical protein